MVVVVVVGTVVEVVVVVGIVVEVVVVVVTGADAVQAESRAAVSSVKMEPDRFIMFETSATTLAGTVFVAGLVGKFPHRVAPAARHGSMLSGDRGGSFAVSGSVEEREK